MDVANSPRMKTNFWSFEKPQSTSSTTQPAARSASTPFSIASFTDGMTLAMAAPQSTAMLPSRKVRVLVGIVEARPDRGHDLVGGADDGVLEMDEVVEPSRQRARGREGDFPARDPPERRPEAVDAVLRGGNADRAAHVRPHRERREARGERRPRSRGRPARGVFEVPRIMGRAPGAGRSADEEVEFRHRRLERHDGAGRLERVDDGGVFRGARRVLVDERALRDPPARPAEFVLDRDRDPFERPCVAAPIAVLGLLRLLQRLIEVRVGDAVDLAIERLDPLDLRLQEIDRRSLPGPEHGDEVVDRRVAERVVGSALAAGESSADATNAVPAPLMSVLLSIMCASMF